MGFFGQFNSIIPQVSPSRSPQKRAAVVRLYDVTNKTSAVLLYQPQRYSLKEGKKDKYVSQYNVTFGDDDRKYILYCRYIGKLIFNR